MHAALVERAIESWSATGRAPGLSSRSTPESGPLATAAGELSPRANIVGVSNSAQRSSSDPCTIYTSMFGDFVSL